MASNKKTKAMKENIIKYGFIVCTSIMVLILGVTIARTYFTLTNNSAKIAQLDEQDAKLSKIVNDRAKLDEIPEPEPEADMKKSGDLVSKAMQDLADIKFETGAVTKANADALTEQADAMIEQYLDKSYDFMKVPGWWIEFSTGVNFLENKVPVVFTIRNNGNEIVSTVVGEYDSEIDKFSSLSQTFTRAGQRDITVYINSLG